MRVKHQPYINPILASWFVPFGTYHRILISYMPHTAAWKTQPASTFWVWNTLQARAVGYLWIILLDLLPFLAFNECSHHTELSHANPRDDTATYVENMFNSPWANLPQAARNWAKAHHGFVPFQSFPTKKHLKKQLPNNLTCTWFSQEIGRWECPRRALTWSSWPGVDFAIRLSGGHGLHWCWITPNKACWCKVETCCFRMNRIKARKCVLFSNGILLLHDYNIMESFNNLAGGWFHL